MSVPEGFSSQEEYDQWVSEGLKSYEAYQEWCKSQGISIYSSRYSGQLYNYFVYAPIESKEQFLSNAL